MATTSRRRRPAPRPRGNSSSILGLGVLAVIVGAVFVLFLVMDKEKDAPPPAPQADPFADLPEEDPWASKKPSAPAGESAGGSGGADPFGDVTSVLQDPLWLEASRKAHDAQDLIDEAVAAREAGDATTAKAKGQKAQALLTEAVDSTRQWSTDLEKRFGDTDIGVRRIQKRLAEWRTKIVALKKSAGL